MLLNYILEILIFLSIDFREMNLSATHTPVSHYSPSSTFTEKCDFIEAEEISVVERGRKSRAATLWRFNCDFSSASTGTLDQ